MAAPEALHAPFVVPPHRAAAYLAALDIDVEHVYAAVGRGDEAAVGIDAFAPSMAAGLARWMTTVAELRRALAGTGRWGIGDRRGQPICRHRATGRTLAVMSGDAATGNPQSAWGPRVVRRKGAATADSFKPDEVLFSLADLQPPFGGSRRAAAAGTWVVLYHRGPSAVHLEVAQPLGFDAEEGQFTGWAVRVILDDHRPAARHTPPRDVGAEIDLQLVRAVA